MAAVMKVEDEITEARDEDTWHRSLEREADEQPEGG